MTKSELIAALVAKNPQLTHQELERVVNGIFDELSTALARGDRAELRGFGAFSVRHRQARQGRNPRTGQSVFVPAKRTPFFKMGKGLKDRLNGK